MCRSVEKFILFRRVPRWGSVFTKCNSNPSIRQRMAALGHRTGRSAWYAWSAELRRRLPKPRNGKRAGRFGFAPKKSDLSGRRTKMATLKWQTPPEIKNTHAIMELLPELAKRPGKWAILREYKSPTTATPTACRLRKRTSGYEFASRSDGNGGSILYGRKIKK